MDWKQRIEIAPAARTFSEIWDGNGWQINKTAEDREKPYLLIDAVMPMMPCSPIVGSFSTLVEAQAEAESRGRPDWSDFEEGHD